MKKLLLITLLLPLGMVGQTIEQLAEANLKPVWEQNKKVIVEDKQEKRSYEVVPERRYDNNVPQQRTLIINREDRILKHLLKSIDKNMTHKPRVKTIVIKQR